jgi:hypothetical protein
VDALAEQRRPLIFSDKQTQSMLLATVLQKVCHTLVAGSEPLGATFIPCRIVRLKPRSATLLHTHHRGGF